MVERKVDGAFKRIVIFFNCQVLQRDVQRNDIRDIELEDIKSDFDPKMGFTSDRNSLEILKKLLWPVHGIIHL